MPQNIDVLAACKDTGGMRGILRVVEKLRAQGMNVRVVANGISSSIVRKAEGHTLPDCISPEEVLQAVSPRLLLTSMCSEGGVGRDLVPHLRGKAVVVALQDQWGARLLESWKDPIHRPDYLIVNDNEGADIVLRAWPDFGHDRIQALGYPALDSYAEVDWEKVRGGAHANLDEIPDSPCIYFAGQLAGTGETLAELAAALDKIRQPVSIIVGKHPRMSPERLPVENTSFNLAFVQLLGLPHVNVLKRGGGDDLLYVAVSDVTVGMYPTALMDAAAARKAAISVMYPQIGVQAYRMDTGGLMEEHPLAALGCVATARDRGGLVGTLREALSGGLAKRLRPNQEKHIRVDGRNAERIVAFLKTLL